MSAQASQSAIQILLINKEWGWLLYMCVHLCCNNCVHIYYWMCLHAWARALSLGIQYSMVDTLNAVLSQVMIG